MKLTPAEKDSVIRHRDQIKLDWMDWGKEPFVTMRDLLNMSAWKVHQLTTDPRFEYDVRSEVLVNKTMDG